MSLFRRQVQLYSLSSGSSGNASYITDGHAGVLIDCGISTKQIFEMLKLYGLDQSPLDAVLITHEHSDHVGAAGVLSRTLIKHGKKVPFYMTQGTMERTNPKSLPDAFEEVRAGEPFRVRHFWVNPMPVPHDAGDPVAYQLKIGDCCVAVVTDLGRPTALVATAMQECDALILEFNHDEQLLMDGPYPYSLKQRIKGPHGHLSNRQAQELLQRGLGSHLRHLLLGHLSEENNLPEKAENAAKQLLKEGGALGRVAVYLTAQRKPVAPIQVETHAW
jgi:phosphoribosyl 1,2-cyclic phosphodiesterase